jgi:hypothetical protein
MNYLDLLALSAAFIALILMSANDYKKHTTKL